MNQPEPFWQRQEWWATRGDTEISLSDLTLQFAQNTPTADRGGAHPEWFGSELQIWCRLLAQTAWLRQEIGPTTAMLATRRVRDKHRDSEAWQTISALLGRYARPLGAYAVSFYGEVYKQRPSVPSKYSDPVRTRARSVAKDVRAAMIDPNQPDGGILSSRAAVGQFLADPDSRRDRDRDLAMRVFAKSIQQYTSNDAAPEAMTPAVSDSVADTGDTFGFAAESLEDGVHVPREDFIEQATSMVWDSAKRNPQLQETSDRHDDLFAYDKLIERTINKVADRLASDKPIQDADDVLKWTHRDMTAEHWRTAGKVSPKGLGHDAEDNDDDLRVSPLVKPHSDERARDRIEQQRLVDQARQYVEQAEVTARRRGDREARSYRDFWEKTVALLILDGQSPLSVDPTESVRKEVIRQWVGEGGRPSDALFTNRVQAAKFVTLLLRLACAKVMTVEDFPDWIGRSANSPEEWAKRLATVEAALQAYRAQDPQRLYDQLHADGGLA